MTVTPPTLPGGLPLLGHLPAILRDPAGFFERAREHGELATVRLGPRRAVLVSSVPLVQRILVQEAEICRQGVLHEKTKVILGEGITSLTGAPHRQARRQLQPFFRSARVAGFAAAMSAVVRARTESWQEQTQIDLVPEFHLLAAQVLVATLFPRAPQDQTVAAITQSLPVILPGLALRSADPTDLLARLPLPSNRRFDRALKRLHATVDALIEASPEADEDLVSCLRAAEASPRMVHDEVASILLAGTQTVANCLAWAACQLLRHPELLERVTREVDQVLGSDRAVSAEHLPELGLTRRVIAETLRLHPPVYVDSRTTVAELRLGGHLLPRGRMLLFSFLALQRDPAGFAEPGRFDPDRWLPERASTCDSSAFLAFSTGPHGCLGEQYAWVEAVAVLAMLLARWELSAAPGPPTRVARGILMTPDQVRVIVRRR